MERFLDEVCEMNSPGREVIRMRLAKEDDVPLIVALLADDSLGKDRESSQVPIPSAYYRAFEEIEADSNNELVVACVEQQVVGVLQLTITRYLTHQGGRRGSIEGVRVDSGRRGQGVGRLMLIWAIERCRHRGCHLVQLTTDKRRAEAKSFYESLGFQASHEGMKLDLS